VGSRIGLGFLARADGSLDLSLRVDAGLPLDTRERSTEGAGRG